ncbi:MAG: hypothetical protein AB7T49_15775 [Oligoflexales bacterium]
MKQSLWIVALLGFTNAYAFDEQDLRSPVSPPAVEVETPIEVQDPKQKPQPDELNPQSADPYVYGDYSLDTPPSSTFGSPALHGFKIGIVMNQNGLGLTTGLDYALNDYVSVVPKFFYKGRYLDGDGFMRQVGPQAEFRLHASPVRTLDFFAGSALGYTFWQVDRVTEEEGKTTLRGQSTVVQGLLGMASIFTPRFRFVVQRVWLNFLHNTTKPVQVSEFRKPEFEAVFEYVI